MRAFTISGKSIPSTYDLTFSITRIFIASLREVHLWPHCSGILHSGNQYIARNRRSVATRADSKDNNNSTKTATTTDPHSTSSSKSKVEGRQPWDLRRFVRTVLYFNPPPSPSDVLQLPFKALGAAFGRVSPSKSQSQSAFVPVRIQYNIPKQGYNQVTAMGPPVTVAEAHTDAAKAIIADVLRQGRSVQALLPPGVDESAIQTSLMSISAAPGARLDLIKNPRSISQLIWPAPPSTSQQLQQLSDLLQFLPKKSGLNIYTPDGLSPTREWGAVDDVVMGGVSSSSFQVRPGAGENGGPAGVFSGYVTTANNGGFASTRTRNLSPPLNIAAYDGFELRVKGDGQRYKFVIKIDPSWDGVGYTASFDTKPDEWQNIRIPFSSLVPVFRARTQSNAAGFDPTKITSIQLMLSKFEYDGRLNPSFREGRFELPVQRISAYSSSASSSSALSEDRNDKYASVVLVSGGAESERAMTKAKEILKSSDVDYVIVQHISEVI